MRKKMLSVLAPIAFLLLLGIVGAVEKGADTRLMLLTIPALLAIASATL